MINEKSASLSSRASRSCDIYITVGQFNTELARSIVFKRGGGKLIQKIFTSENNHNNNKSKFTFLYANDEKFEKNYKLFKISFVQMVVA